MKANNTPLRAKAEKEAVEISRTIRSAPQKRASEAGAKGGHESDGNFAHDRDRASEAGRKGGQS